MEHRAPLHLVDAPSLPGESAAARGDVGLLLFLLAVSFLPIGGALAGGHWDDGSVGLATLIALLSGRELLHELLGRRPSPRR